MAIAGRDISDEVIARIRETVRSGADHGQRPHGYQPVLIETFVDSTRYRGTCSRAANWIDPAATQGRGRYDLARQGRVGAHGEARPCRADLLTGGAPPDTAQPPMLGIRTAHSELPATTPDRCRLGEKKHRVRRAEGSREGSGWFAAGIHPVQRRP